MQTFRHADGPVAAARTEQPVIALTFDDGPDPQGTPAILDLLARYQARATFFVVGRSAAKQPQLLQRIAAEGHQIANHTHEHLSVIGLSLRHTAFELLRCEAVLLRRGLRGSRWMRPPFGAIDARACRNIRLLGYQCVNWSVAGEDWRGAPAEFIADRIVRGMRPGAIVLLHDGLEPNIGSRWRECDRDMRDRRPTIEALERVLITAGARSLTCVTVEALLHGAEAERQRLL